MPQGSGFLRLSSPRFVKEDPAITGGDLWLYAWHLQQLGPFRDWSAEAPTSTRSSFTTSRLRPRLRPRPRLRLR